MFFAATAATAVQKKTVFSNFNAMRTTVVLGRLSSSRSLGSFRAAPLAQSRSHDLLAHQRISGLLFFQSTKRRVRLFALCSASGGRRVDGAGYRVNSGGVIPKLTERRKKKRRKNSLQIRVDDGGDTLSFARKERSFVVVATGEKAARGDFNTTLRGKTATATATSLDDSLVKRLHI